MATIAEQIKGLKEQRGSKVKELEKLAGVIAERAFTPDEQTQYDRLTKDIEGFNSRLKVSEEQEIRTLGGAKVPTDNTNTFDERNASEPGITILKRLKVDKARPISDWYLRNFDVKEEMQKADVYRLIRSLATGKAPDTATSHALNETRSVSGTALLNPYLGAQLWDGLLPKTRLGQAGMKTIPLLSNQHKFAKITAYPTFEWKAESASTTDKTATFANVTFDAKTLRGFVRTSGELLQDGLNTEQALKQVINKSAAGSVDSAGLIGSGSGAEPKGVINYTNINTYTMTGSNGSNISSYDPFIEAYKLILDDNGEMPTAAIMNPREWATINKFKTTSVDAYRELPTSLKDLLILETSKMPINLTKGASSNCGAIIFGGFDSLYLGQRLDITIQVSPVITSTYEYDIFMAFRGDFQAAREEDFGMINGINPLA
jgi:HK97 family phage major capsid protein